MEMDSDIIIEIRELSDKIESLRRFMLDAPYMNDIEEKMDLELRLKKAVMENDALLFLVAAKDNRIAKLVAENYADLIEAHYDGRTSIYTETEVTYEDGRKGAIKATLSIADANVAPEQRMAAE